MELHFLLPVLFMGVWTDMVVAKSLNLTNSLSIPHYRVVTVADEESVLNNPGDPKKPFKGLFVDLLDSIADLMNFTYTITGQPDNEYGNNRAPGGKWNGMMGSLIDDKADLAMGSLIATPEREAVATFAKAPFNLTAAVVVNPVFGIVDIQYLVDSKTDLYILSKSKNPRAQQIWEVLKKQNPNDSVVTQEKAAEKVAHGKFGFIGGVESVDKMAAASNGTLFRIPGPIETGVSLAPFAVKKDSKNMKEVIRSISDALQIALYLTALNDAFEAVGQL